MPNKKPNPLDALDDARAQVEKAYDLLQAERDEQERRHRPTAAPIGSKQHCAEILLLSALLQYGPSRWDELLHYLSQMGRRPLGVASREVYDARDALYADRRIKVVEHAGSIYDSNTVWDVNF